MATSTVAHEPSGRDQTDWTLIALLQADGRSSYESLATAIGLSKVATRSRVKRMLDSGVVRVVGVAHPSLLGMTHSARISIDTLGPSLPIARRIADEVPGVVFVALSTGPRAIVVELRVASLGVLTSSVRALRLIPGVASSETALYTEILRDANIALDHALTVSPDEIDLRIISSLQGDGRQSFVALAAEVGLSAASVRARVNRLLDTGAVSVQTLVSGAPDDPTGQAGFALDVRFDEDFDATAVLDVDGVTFLAGTFGVSDFFGTVQAPSLAAVADVIEKLRAVPGVLRVRSWIHFEIVREDYGRPLPVGSNRPSGQS